MFNTFGISVVIDKCKESVVNVEVIKFEFGDQLFSNAFEMQKNNLSRPLQEAFFYYWLPKGSK